MKMMRKCMTALLWGVMLTAALLAQAQSHKVVKVGDFTSLKVSNNINVIYCADVEKAGTAEFDAQQSIANVFIFTTTRANSIFNSPTTISLKACPPSRCIRRCCKR